MIPRSLPVRTSFVRAAVMIIGTATVMPGFARASEPLLAVSPTSVELDDIYSHQQLLVTIPGRLGPQDVTRQVAYVSSNPQIVRVDAAGYLVPLAPGRTQVEVSWQGRNVRVPVAIKTFDRDRPLHFANDIVPLLNRSGCNSGGCHGRASGQNGFKLSLFGFDPSIDYDALVKEGRGRRINATAPEASLFLAKAAGLVPHGGGRRWKPDDEAYQIVLRWSSRRSRFWSNGAASSCASAPSTGMASAATSAGKPSFRATTTTPSPASRRKAS
jgi:hypothetical protein